MIIGLFSFIGLCGIGGTLLVFRGTEQEKRGFIFGLVILLLATIIVGAWYRSNRLFISSVGVAVVVGILVSGGFRCLHRSLSFLRLLVGGATLIFFNAYPPVNLSGF